MPYSSFTLLLLIAFPGLLLSPQSVDGVGEYAPFFVRSQALLLRLNQEPTASNYDSARHAWERISWLIPVHPPEDKVAPLDNNKHWVLGPAADHNYAEAGAWQHLELQTKRSAPDADAIKRYTGRITTYLRRLQYSLSQQPLRNEDIRFLLATEIYRQYNLTLTGHHRLDPSRAKGDFLGFLTGLQQWDKIFLLFAGKEHNLLAETITFCEAPAFEQVDRYVLYRHYLRPLYRSLLQGVPADVLARKYRVAAAADGSLFSSAFMAPVTVHHSTAQAKLGKLLFFDPLLSGNGRRSCASCHQPTKAYTDGRTTSMAFDYPQRITRNAPSLINVTTGYGPSGLDQGKPGVGHFIQSVFDHPQELNVRMDTIVNRLNRSAGYREAFSAAFPITGLDSTSILTALEAFVLNLKGVTSAFDREVRSATIPSDSAAIRGYNLFMGKGNCGSCHFPPYFDGRKPPFYLKQSYQSAGRSGRLKDLGVGGYLKDSRYDYYYRTPGIRNLSYSAPYGHDGYFITLQKFTKDHHKRIRLNASEIADLLQFMKTLNDSLDLEDTYEVKLPPVDDLTPSKNRRPAGLY